MALAGSSSSSSSSSSSTTEESQLGSSSSTTTTKNGNALKYKEPNASRDDLQNVLNFYKEYDAEVISILMGVDVDSNNIYIYIYHIGAKFFIRCK